ncbi:MAG: post-transcriptional regulator [Erysipelothrix sp.]|nr:post-transcriptional regulator [Erysipelothrix sp.]
MIDQSNRQLQLAMVLKLQMLQRDGLAQLSYQQLERVMFGWMWRKGIPASLHEAIEDLFRLSADEVVVVLSKQAIMDGSKKNLSDFNDLIEGVSK